MSENFLSTEAPHIFGQVAGSFQHRQPYPYADMSGAFDPQLLSRCAREIEQYITDIPAEKNIYGSYRKHKLSELERMPAACKAMIAYLNGPEFIARLEEITGVQGLQPDPELRGGGIHAIGRGGFLKVHTDFNWHGKLQLHRRLNLLIYLNEDWQEEWGGAIEMWSPDMKTRLASMPPRIGNVLLFATSDISYHGHPDPLQCPEDVWRKSFAMYYYSANRPEDEVKFGRSEMTNYVERPGETFEMDRVRRLRHKIHLGIKRLTK